jgi:hypothetical protein
MCVKESWTVWRGVIPVLLLCVIGLLCAPAVGKSVPDNEPTVEELKARIGTANPSDKVHLCVQVAEKQLTEADKLYASGDVEKGQTALTDVASFSELARDYSIESKKHQKQTEIAVRGMTRKLNSLLHTLGHDDQAAVKDAINRLERVRDDLLLSMFPKGAK